MKHNKKILRLTRMTSCCPGLVRRGCCGNRISSFPFVFLLIISIEAQGLQSSEVVDPEMFPGFTVSIREGAQGIQANQFWDLYLQIISSMFIPAKVSGHSGRTFLYDRRWCILGVAFMTNVTEMFTKSLFETLIGFTYVFNMATGAG